MRPREREDTSTPSPASSPPQAAPAPAHALSSMVVRPTDNSGGDGGGDGSGDSDLEKSPSTLRHDKIPFNLRRRESSPVRGSRWDSPTGSRRRDSPPSFRRRDFSPPPFRRRDSPPPPFHRRNSPPPPTFRRRDSPMGFQPRSERFGDNAGYGIRPGSISPPYNRGIDDYRFDPAFGRPTRPSFGRGGRSGRGDPRFQDMSPRYGTGRGSSGRGYGASVRRQSPFEGEYVHRNDPNLSPREGDWICQNPTCGNLNFARREYCNNCNEYRYAPEHRGPSRSPRKGYLKSSSPYRSPPTYTRPVDRGLRRDINGYRSPPRNYPVDDPRDFRSGSPPPGRGGRFLDDLRRDRADYRKQDTYANRRKFDWQGRGDWDPRDQGRNDFIPNRREYDHRSPSGGRWIGDTRERSRSPVAGRPLPYMARGRGGHRWHYDDQRIVRRQIDDSEVGRGRGYPRGDDTVIGRGRGHRQGSLHGGNGNVY